MRGLRDDTTASRGKFFPTQALTIRKSLNEEGNFLKDKGAAPDKELTFINNSSPSSTIRKKEVLIYR